jgi:hypothetical protein
MLPSASFMIIEFETQSLESSGPRFCLVVTSAVDESALQGARAVRDISRPRAAQIFERWSEEISKLFKDQTLSDAAQKVRESNPELPYISELLVSGLLTDSDDFEGGQTGPIKLEWTQSLRHPTLISNFPTVKWTCFIAPPKAAALKVETQMQLLEALWKSEVGNHGLILHGTSKAGSDVRTTGESSTSPRSGLSGASVGLSALESVPEEQEFTTEQATTGDSVSTGGSSRWPSLLSLSKLRKGKGKRA